MKYYNNVYSITCYDQIDECVQQVLDFDYDDEISVVLSHNVDFTEIEKIDRIYMFPKMCKNQPWLCKPPSMVRFLLI
jgi:hypothetical protein